MKHIFYFFITSLFLSALNLHAAPVQPLDYGGNEVPYNRGVVLTSRDTYEEEIKAHINQETGDNPAFYDLLTQAKDKDIAKEGLTTRLQVMGERVRLNNMKAIGQKLPKRIAIVAHGGQEFIRVGTDNVARTVRFEGRKLAKQLAPFIEDDSLIDIVACKACNFAERFAAELKSQGISAKVRGFNFILTPDKDTLFFTDYGFIGTDYRKFLLTGTIDEEKLNDVEEFVAGYDTTLENMDVESSEVVEWYREEALNGEELETCL